MCGIIGYTGNREASKILLSGLNSLEYRGYDSSGIYIPGSGCIKAIGQVSNLAKKIDNNFSGKSGIAHTRWATHGEPTELNAHPHCDSSETFWIAHNGIIENYKELKANLEQGGHSFLSDTDSEIIAHLISEKFRQSSNFEKAVVLALNMLNGAYGLVIMHENEPGKIIAARMGSPLAIGVGRNEHFIASDSAPILQYTKRVLYINDGEFAVITPKTYKIFTLTNLPVSRSPNMLNWSADSAKKGGFEHFMLKEIMEAPEVTRSSTRGRVIRKSGKAKLGGLIDVEKQLEKIERIIIVGCGTAYYAGLVGEYMLEEFAGIPVEVENGSEFRYRSPIINPRTAVIAISQSGETADTLEAIRESKKKGALTLGIVNSVGSTISRETDAGIYNHIGPEISVASTKAFISQLCILALLTLFLGRQRGMNSAEGKKIANEIVNLPAKIEEALKVSKHVKKLARKYLKYENFLYIGRKYHFPIALEGALKLKEISYVHAEGYAAGEMKHGPIALIDKNFPTIAIVPKNSVYKKTLSNMQEIKARQGKIIAITTKDADNISDLADDIIYIPESAEILSPVLATIPLQLFAYYFALGKGASIDKPRNLAKSVTVE